MSISTSVAVSSPNGPVELENPAGGTTIMSISPGERGHILAEAASPIMDGTVITGYHADRMTATLTIRCWGPAGTVLGKLVEMESLFTQLAFTVTVTLDGHSEVWHCGPANTARGQSGSYSAEELNAGWQDLVVSLPRQPDNSLGVSTWHHPTVLPQLF